MLNINMECIIAIPEDSKCSRELLSCLRYPCFLSTTAHFTLSHLGPDFELNIWWGKQSMSSKALWVFWRKIIAPWHLSILQNHKVCIGYIPSLITRKKVHNVACLYGMLIKESFLWSTYCPECVLTTSWLRLPDSFYMWR